MAEKTIKMTVTKKAWLGVLLAAFSMSCAAENVRIMTISNPELVEIKRASDGEYFWLSDLETLKPPIQARRGKANMLRFRHGGAEYEVARGDVTLDREATLVVDACNTVPVSLRSDSRQASVKGAGEGCK